VTAPISSTTAAQANDSPLVSVLTAVYNGERFLPETIAGVVAQSYPHWEYWIVNDGSTDNTAAILKRAAAEHPGRILIVEHPGGVNRGLGASRNLALAHARGRYVALLDADDLWLPNKLAEQVALARQFPHAGLLYGRSEYWRDWSGDPQDAGKNETPPLVAGDRLYEPPKLMRLHIRHHPERVPCPSALLIDRELLCRLGGMEEAFDAQQALFEDHALLAKLYLAAPVYVSSQCWDRYRIHPDSICAAAERSGALPAARRYYLEWLRGYLRSQNVTDQPIWDGWRRASLFYRHPAMHWVARAARRLRRGI